MDSKSFMDVTGGPDYSQVIDIFQKIWEVNGYRLLARF
jgi:hypothetical protein